MEIILISSSILSFLLIYFTQKKFLKDKMTVRINNRSSHNVVATSNGGLAIFLTIFIISIWNYLKGVTLFDYSLLIPLAIMTLLGMYDDNKTVDFKLKFIFQIIVAKIIIDNGFIIDNLHGVLNIYELNNIVAQCFTIFVVVGIINAVNFIDGIDGLAVSITSIFIISFEFFNKSYPEFSALSFIMLGSFIPVLIFNFKKKNKVFLGDGGSLLLGTLISIYTIFILSNNYIIRNEFDINKILFVISILVYPFIDISRVFLLRIINKKSPFIADKNHIHHLLLRKMNSHSLVSITISAISILIITLFQIIF
tara:strand:+ start:44 stop:973 length:930 start_codon:yes stop_codon:yes gene_type:complete